MESKITPINVGSYWITEPILQLFLPASWYCARHGAIQFSSNNAGLIYNVNDTKEPPFWCPDKNEFLRSTMWTRTSLTKKPCKKESVFYRKGLLIWTESEWAKQPETAIKAQIDEPTDWLAMPCLSPLASPSKRVSQLSNLLPHLSPMISAFHLLPSIRIAAALLFNVIALH